jgi:uncharacterized membrane protein YdjX (TVP38/TMEM64 family)
MKAKPTQLVQRIRIMLAFGIVGAACLVLFATPVGGQLWVLLREPSAERVEQILPATAIWLSVAIIGLMVLHTLVPLPAEVLALAAGMTLGPFWGFLTIWVGAMLGAWLGFFLARTLGQPFLQYLITPERLDRWMGRMRYASVPFLLAVRLLPVISFNLINYALGLSPIGWWRFTWSTGVGIVPVTVFVVVFGAHLNDWRVVALMIVALLLVGLGGYLLLRGGNTPVWFGSKLHRS